MTKEYILMHLHELDDKIVKIHTNHILYGAQDLECVFRCACIGERIEFYFKEHTIKLNLQNIQFSHMPGACLIKNSLMEIKICEK